jgi:hypothetical protein
MHRYNIRFGTIEELRANAISEINVSDREPEVRVHILEAALKHFDYANLSREDKGLVRLYLQSLTGYSRAQTARYITAYTHKPVTHVAPAVVTLPALVTPRFAVQPWMWTVSAAMFLLLLAGADPGNLTSSALNVLNAERTDITRDVLHAAALKAVTQKMYVVNTMTHDVDGSEQKYPLLTVNSQTVNDENGYAMQETIIEASMQDLLDRVYQRRLARLHLLEQKRTATRPDVLTDKEQFPVYPNPNHAAAPMVWDIPAGGTEGQILMVQNGRIIWHDFPYLEQIRNEAPHSTEATRRAGGNRSGGADSSQTTTTTNTTIIQQTGGGSASSGWTDGDAIVYLTESTDKVGIGTDSPDTKLEVTGTVSGSALHAQDSITSSGGLVWEGDASGATLWVSTFAGAGLTDCDAGTSKLTYDATTGRFICDIDQTVGTGLSQTTADLRYVKKQGDTMTGALVINITNGNANTIGLNVLNTVSGAVLHAEKSLTSSGTLVWEGAASGASLYVATSINGAGLVDCDIAGTSKLLWDSTTGRFSCGTDTDTDTNTTYAAGRGIGLNGTSFSLNSTITGALVRFNTVSGSTIYAQSALNASGSLSVDGTAYLNSNAPLKLTNAGFYNCTALETDADGDIVCGSDTDTDTNTTYTAGQGLSLSSTVFSLNSTITGSLVRFTTVSGSTVFARNALNASGTLAVDGAAAFNNSSFALTAFTNCTALETDVNGNLVCGSDADTDTNTTYTAGQGLSLNGTVFTLNATLTGTLLRFNTLSGSTIYAKNTLASSGTLVFEGAASGSSLYVAMSIRGSGLADCDSANSVLQWNDTTGRFSCSTITSGTTYTAGQGLSLSAGNAFSLNSTITGALIRFNTVSGSTIYARNQLTSSGTLVTESGAYIDGDTFVVQAGNNRVGIGTATPGGTLEVVGDVLFNGNNGTKIFFHEEGDANWTLGREGAPSGAQIVTQGAHVFVVYGSGDNQGFMIRNNGGTSLFEVQGSDGLTYFAGNVGIGTASASTKLEVVGTASGRVIYAQQSLRSSGSLVWEGAASGSSLYVATSIKGAGLSDCDAANSVLQWNDATGRFSCSTITSGTTYTAGQGLTLNGTSFRVSSTLTGTLANFTTISGSTLFARNQLTSSGTIVTESGAIFDAGTLYVDAVNNRVGIGTTTPSATLHVIGQLWTYGNASFNYTGVNVGNTNIDSSGNGGAARITAYDGSANFNLMLNTNGASWLNGGNIGIGTSTPKGKLHVVGSGTFIGSISGSSLTISSLRNCDTIDTDANGNLICGTDQSAGSGLDQNTADARYVNTSGDSMTGALTINVTGGNRNTIALNVLNTISGAVIHAEKSLTSSGTLVWEGAASGSSLYISSSINGAGLVDCDIAGTSKLLWDSTTGRFSCGTDTDTDTNTTYTAGRGLGLNGTSFSLNSTITGALVRFTTLSGSIVYAKTTLASSGSLVWEGAASGASLYIGGTLEGAGLVDCDLATQTLAWDSTTKRFSCGTDSDTTYTAGKGLTLTSTSFSLNSTITGALVNFTTVSGSLVKAKNTLASSGSLAWEGAASGASLYIGGTLEGAGLTDCDLATQTLAWDATTKRFSCGTDTDTTYTAGQGLTLTSTAFKTNATLTGSLVNFTTVSGSLVKAKTTLASSGTIIAEGNITTNSGSLWQPVYRTDDGLIGYWSFSESGSTVAYDHSPYGRDGTLSGGPQYSAGKYGTALNFDGTNDKVTIPATATFGDATFSIWFNSDVSSTQSIWESTDDFIDLQTGTAIRIVVDLTTTNFTIPTVAVGSWHHLAVVKRGASFRVFLDGVESLDGAQTVDADAAFTSIGGYNGDIGTNYWNGKLDEARIYNRALTEEEIRTQYLGVGTDNAVIANKFRILDTGNNLLVNVSSGRVLEVMGTVSGSTIFANTSLRSSGSLVWEGAASGATLYLGGKLEGAGLTDCDLSTQALKWDATTGRFSCGSAGSTYTAGQGLSLSAGNAFSLNTTITGALVRFTTISGSTVYAKNQLTSSGTLITESGAYFDGTTMVIQAGSNRVGIGTATPEYSLDVLGQIRGTVFNLVGGDAVTDMTMNDNLISMRSTMALRWNNADNMAGGYDIGIVRQGTSTLQISDGSTGIGSLYVGTLSGNILKAQKSLNSSGSLVWEGAASGATLYLGGKLEGAGLTDCDLSTQALKWDATTGRFSCGSASNFGSGNVMFIGDSRYVRTAGGTMTGALTIQNGNTHAFTSTPLLNVRGVMSGMSLYISGTGSSPLLMTNTATGAVGIGTGSPKGALHVVNASNKYTTIFERTGVNGAGATFPFAMRSDGQTVGDYIGLRFEGKDSTGGIQNYGGIRIGIQNPTNNVEDSSVDFITFENGASNVRMVISGSLVGIGTLAPKTKLEVVGTVSGSSLTISGLRNCNTIDTDANGVLSCGTDETASSGLSVSSGDARYVNQSGDTMSGALAIYVGSTQSITADAGLALEVIGTASGRTIYAQQALRSSGSLVWEGAASGATLYLGGKLEGAGLTDCDADNQTLAWDSTTGRFTCGDDDTGGSSVTAGRGLALNGSILTLNATITGSLVNFTTVSGSTVFANTLLTSSGTLVTESGAYFDGTTMVIQAGSNRVGIGTATPAATLDVAGGINLSGTINGRLTVSNSGIIHGNNGSFLQLGGTYLFEDESGNPANILAQRNFSSPTSAQTFRVYNTYTSATVYERATLRWTNNVLNIGTENGGTGTARALAFITGSGERMRIDATGNVGIGENSPSTKLEVAGSISGSTLYITSSMSGAGLTDCDTASSVLQWNDSTDRFSCTTISGGSVEVGTVSFSGAVVRLGNTQWVKKSGDTMTGTLRVRTGTSGTSTGKIALLLSNGMTGVLIDQAGSAGELGINYAGGTTLFSVNTTPGYGTLMQFAAEAYQNYITSTTSGGLVASQASTDYYYQQADSDAWNGLNLMAGTVGTYIKINPDLQGQTANALQVSVIEDSGTAQTYITASGAFVVNDSGNRNGYVRFESDNNANMFYLDAVNDRIGIGTNAPDTTLDVIGTISGRLLTLNGAGTNYIKDGALAIGGTTVDTGLKLEVVGTMSGRILKAMNTLASSGTLVWEGAASGATLYLGGKLEGAGLTDCDTANSSKLLWDATTGRFSCGTDQTGGGSVTAGRGLALNGSVLTLNATITGSLVNFTTVSGSTVYAKTSFSSSGSLTWEGAASGATLYLGGKLEGAGLVDCDTDNQTLAWDATTGRFLCGDDDTGGGSVTAGQGLTLNNSVLTLNGTITGSLVRFTTLSGSTVFARNSLSSSGVLIVKSLVKTGSGAATFVPVEFQTGAYIYGSGASALALDGYVKGADASRSPHILFGYRGTFDTNLYRSAASRLQTDGSLYVLSTLSGATIHAEKTLSSSGILAIDNTTYLNSGAIITGKLLPSADDIYDLGSTDKRWRDLYLGPASIHIGSAGDEGVISYNTLTNDIEFDVSGDSVPEFSILSSGTLESASLSGSLIRAKNTLASSGSLIWEGAASGATLYIGGTIEGAGLLSDCDGDGQTLGWDATTKRFTCGDDDSSGSGLDQTNADLRYVNTSGDTMTGILVIQNGNTHTATATPLLNVRGTMSGRSLQITGTGARPLISTNLGRGAVGIGTSNPGNDVGTYSNVVLLELASQNARNSDLALRSASKTTYGSWIDFFTSSGTLTSPQAVVNRQELGNIAFLGYDGSDFSDSAYIDVFAYGSPSSGKVASDMQFMTKDTLGTSHYTLLSGTGYLAINGTASTHPKTTLEVFGTSSGTTFYASRSLRSSGSLVWEGAASGATLYLGGKLEGAGLTDCNSSANNALQWDGTTGRFGCVTIAGGGNFGSGNVVFIGDTRYVRTAGGTMTGALTVNVTGGNNSTLGLKIINALSGSYLHAEKSLSTSGTLVWEGAASGASLYIASSLQGVGLTDCDSDAQTLGWDAATGRFVCLTDNSVGTGLDQNSGDLRYIRKAGGTMTGALTIDITGGTQTSLGLNVKNTISGAGLVLSKLRNCTLGTTGTGLVICDGGSDLQMSQQVLKAVTIANTATHMGTVRITPSSTTGDVYVTAAVSTRSLSNTDQTITLQIRNGTDCTGTLFSTMTGTLTTASAANGPNLFASYLEVDAGTTEQTYSACILSSVNAGAGADGQMTAMVIDTGADYAEFYTTNDETMAAGDIVALDPVLKTGVRKSSGTDDQSVIGIVSTQPGKVIGSVDKEGTKAVPVALAGRVPVKVSGENGPIHAGDLLTASSIPGVAMKAGYTGYVIGQAITDFEGEGMGTVLVFIKNFPLGTDDGFTFIQGSGALLGYLKVDQHLVISSSGSLNVQGLATFGSGVTIHTAQNNGSDTVLSIITDAGGSDNTVLKVNASGSVFTDGTYNSDGADYAEWFASKDTLEQDEVVCIDVTRSNTVKRCDRDADGNVMGIVSTNPAFIGNSVTGATGIVPPGYALIGLIGQVPAKVMVENDEAIRPGDPLTAAGKPGYARRAKAGESTVGVALEGLESGEGIINVLISRRNQSLTVEAVEDNVLKTIADMEIEDEVQLMVAGTLEDLNVDQQITDEVTRQIDVITQNQQSIAAINEEIAYLKNEIEKIKSQTGSSITTTVTATGSFHLAASTLELDSTLVTGGDARIGGDLSIDGTLNASSLFVPNGLTIDGGVVMKGMLEAQQLHITEEATVDGVLTINGTLNLGSGARLNLGSGALTIDQLVVENALFVMGDITIQGLATFLGDINVKGELIVSNNQAGFAMIPKSGTSVTVYFGTGFHATPVVTASPDYPVAYAVHKSSATGFTIFIAAPAVQDILFSWHALSTSAPVTIRADVSEDGTIIFPMATDEIPVSSNMAWNACIRNIPMFDDAGQPLSCSRYHDGYTWSHPDLGITFIWNTSLNPTLLKVPDGYKPTVTENAQSILDAINGGIENDGEDAEPQTDTGSVTAEPVTETGTTVPAEEPVTETGDTVVPAETEPDETDDAVETPAAPEEGETGTGDITG